MEDITTPRPLRSNKWKLVSFLIGLRIFQTWLNSFSTDDLEDTGQHRASKVQNFDSDLNSAAH